MELTLNPSQHPQHHATGGQQLCVPRPCIHTQLPHGRSCVLCASSLLSRLLWGCCCCCCPASPPGRIHIQRASQHLVAQHVGAVGAGGGVLESKGHAVEQAARYGPFPAPCSTWHATRQLLVGGGCGVGGRRGKVASIIIPGCLGLNR